MALARPAPLDQSVETLATLTQLAGMALARPAPLDSLEEGAGALGLAARLGPQRQGGPQPGDDRIQVGRRPARQQLDLQLPERTRARRPPAGAGRDEVALVEGDLGDRCRTVIAGETGRHLISVHRG